MSIGDPIVPLPSPGRSDGGNPIDSLLAAWARWLKRSKRRRA